MAGGPRLRLGLVPIMIAVLSAPALGDLAVGKCPSGMQPCGDAGCADSTTLVCNDSTGQCQSADANAALKNSIALFVDCLPFANACGSTLCDDNQLCIDDQCQQASGVLPFKGNISDAQALATTNASEPSADTTSLDACTKALESTPNCNSGSPSSPLTSADCLDLGFDPEMATLPGLQCFSSGSFVCAAWSDSIAFACAGGNTNTLDGDSVKYNDDPDDTESFEELLSSVFPSTEGISGDGLPDCVQPALDSNDSSVPDILQPAVDGNNSIVLDLILQSADDSNDTSILDIVQSGMDGSESSILDVKQPPMDSNDTSAFDVLQPADDGNDTTILDIVQSALDGDDSNILDVEDDGNGGHDGYDDDDSNAGDERNDSSKADMLQQLVNAYDSGADIDPSTQDLFNLTANSDPNILQQLVARLIDIAPGTDVASIVDWVNDLLTGLFNGDSSGSSEAEPSLDADAMGSAGAADAGAVPLPILAATNPDRSNSKSTVATP